MIFWSGKKVSSRNGGQMKKPGAAGKSAPAAPSSTATQSAAAQRRTANLAKSLPILFSIASAVTYFPSFGAPGRFTGFQKIP